MNQTKSQVGDQVTVAKGIQKIPSQYLKYRARKMIRGTKYEFRTNNLQEAKRWMREMDVKASKKRKS